MKEDVTMATDCTYEPFDIRGLSTFSLHDVLQQSGINSSILANKSLEVQDSSGNEKLNENLKFAWSGDLISLKCL